ncbi:MAG: endonuclease III [Ruminococcus sp.]|nr:endonuclease III [Ruminococcus sp.]
MTKKQLTLKSVEALKEAYPEAICSLVYSDPLQLLIATRLSAQCTDARVNIVTPELFSKYKTLDDLANAEVEDVEKIIRSCGFYHDKARDIVGIAKKIKSDFNGEVPSTIEELTSLPGVGRKTANLIMGDVFHAPSSVVTDTHLIRISNRIGLVDTKDPKKVEFELRKLLPPDESNDFCHRTVLHGRAVCTARKAHCDICTLKDFCKKKI